MERNIEHLKDAMMSILSDIRKGDLISVIEFSKDVIVWDIQSETSKVITYDEFNNFDEPFQTLDKLSLPSPVLVDDVTIGKAKKIMQTMLSQESSRFVIGALEVALYMAKVGQEQIVDNSSKHQPIMVFLTFGHPNIGSYSTEEIIDKVTTLNLGHINVPIFSLSFSGGSNMSFLRELSLKNFGSAMYIYEASDVSLQLQSFYQQISSPLLTNIKFEYESDVTEVTRSHFPIYFRGSELVVSGKCRACQLPYSINCCGSRNLGSVVKNPVVPLERLWAYLTVKQLLEERNTAVDKKELTKKAVDLALKYSFNTEVTSLVVLTPSEICDIKAPLDIPDVEPKRRGRRRCGFGGRKKGKAQREPVEVVVVEDSQENCKAQREPVDVLVVDDSQEDCEAQSESEETEVVEDLPEYCEETEEIQPEEPKKLQFIADRPFFVAVLLQRGEKKLPLFMGFIDKPSY